MWPGEGFTLRVLYQYLWSSRMAGRWNVALCMGVSLAELLSAGSVNDQVSRVPLGSIRRTVVGVSKAMSSMPV